MRYLIFEAKITLPWGIFLLSLFLAILRLTKTVSPVEPLLWQGWIFFLEFVYPVLFPVFSFTLLEQEKRWRTLEVMVAAPRPTAAVLFMRYIFLIFLLFCGIAAAVRSGEYIFLLAPGLALGGAALLLGLVFGEEAGLGLALGWWAFSFAMAVARAESLKSGIQSWVLLILSGASLSPPELLLRKWAHFGCGAFLFLLALGVAEWKRSWSLK